MDNSADAVDQLLISSLTQRCHLFTGRGPSIFDRQYFFWSPLYTCIQDKPSLSELPFLLRRGRGHLFERGHQNSAQKGTAYGPSNPKGTMSVPFIFLNA